MDKFGKSGRSKPLPVLNSGFESHDFGGSDFAHVASPTERTRNDILDTPNWQADFLTPSAAFHSASTGKEVLIIDVHNRLVDASARWQSALADMAGIEVRGDHVVFHAEQTRYGLERAKHDLALGISQERIGVLLRDMDGWVKDVLVISRADLNSADAFLIILPPKNAAREATLAMLGDSAGLTQKERVVLGAIWDGQSEIDTQRHLDLKAGSLRPIMQNIIRKFGVAHKSDLVRLFAHSASMLG